MTMTMTMTPIRAPCAAAGRHLLPLLPGRTRPAAASPRAIRPPAPSPPCSSLSADRRGSSSTASHCSHSHGAGASPRQRQRLRRSVHFVPADNERFLSKCLSLGADTVVLDLEDSVRDKSAGRETLRSFLGSMDPPPPPPGGAATEVLVRINPLSSPGEFGREAWRDDLEAGFDGSDGFVVPKVESIDELRVLDEALSAMEGRASPRNSAAGSPGAARRVLFPITTETPAAALNVADVARGPRVCAITWGCEDLSAELGSLATRDGADGRGAYLDVFRHCRSMCLLSARAAGVQAIDGIYQDVRDGPGFAREAREAMVAGFDGKLTLHPDQISTAHRAFEPTEDELGEARAIAAAWEGGDGRGSLEHEGRMIDLPHYSRARKIIARSAVGGRAVEDKTKEDAAKDSNEDMAAGHATNDSMKAASACETKSSIDPIRDDSNEAFPRVYLGRYFDDLAPGTTIRHFLTRTVTESDNVFFTCLTLNPAPIHLDHELSRGHGGALTGEPSRDGPGRPLFNSMFTLALLVGMSVPESTHGTTVANLGFSEVKFPKPVYPGDTLRAETEVLDRRESKSRPSQGIVTLRHVAYNQRGEAVCSATRQALMKKRP